MLPHGGNLSAARARFPHAPLPWLDLSTGISPHAYPLPPMPPDVLARLPEPADVARLCALAAARFGATREQVVAAPGTQILLPLVAALLPPGRARVLGFTYAEHARAAALAGHALVEGDADLLAVVNPNNPDGRLLSRDALRALPARLLVVDEAFAEVSPRDETLCGDVADGRTVVLRSFGKFHGLAGLRLGFAVAAAPLAERLRARLGPWAVSGPALWAGLAALADDGWAAAQRARLRQAADALDAVLRARGCRLVGGTSLFRLVEAPPGTHARLGRAGILTRDFAEHPAWLRFGLPPDEAALHRLDAALA